ncbi:hypothetical protein E0485_22275 [Paenibacillus albiflavus]|uniref:Uncharacterized protein n=1 Tax=Paenibacillus albiflavus TaxID=2545760 RepID=A0A4V2WMS1_9BACL|nr:hypothetical protein [Paenibacillus albiflavus]TCZ72317.1 hypothetical protein E0485_22275 [Paenibacillus albiflavus]
MQPYLDIITIIVLIVLIVGVPILIGKLASPPTNKIALVIGFIAILSFLGYQLLGADKMFYPFAIALAIEWSWRYWREKKKTEV